MRSCPEAHGQTGDGLRIHEAKHQKNLGKQANG